MNGSFEEKFIYFRDKSYALEKEVKRLTHELDNYQANTTNYIEQALKQATTNYQKIIDELNVKITKLESKLSINSTNSSLPPSKNPLQVKIPNSRETTDKKIGGQPGHKRHVLKPFTTEEITSTVDHELDKCPHCNSELIHLGTSTSDIIDFEIKTTRTHNVIHNYECKHCHEKITANSVLPHGVSYGVNVNANALTLMNEANVPINKVAKHIFGITNGDVDLSEGYIAKLQSRTASGLNSFILDLKAHIIKEPIVNWDDTVLNINNKDGYMRFYGNDKCALLIGHDSKKAEGIEADAILKSLDENTTVVHDHVLYNYNSKFKFKNAECNQHILRYLKGVSDNLHEESWCISMRDLLKKLNDERKAIILDDNQDNCFKEEYILESYQKYKAIINLGYEENKKVPDYHFYKGEELSLISRLDKFIDAHLLFIKDFSVPFTNNTAEQGLRLCKRKIVVSALFKNLATLENYGKIMSYIETCYRNNISRYQALKRLLEKDPYTISEIFSKQ